MFGLVILKYITDTAIHRSGNRLNYNIIDVNRFLLLKKL